MYVACTIISKVRPTLKIIPPPFLNEAVAKGALLMKIATPTYLCHSPCSYVKQEGPKKQHCIRGSTNNWRQTPFAVTASSSTWQKSIAESLHAYIHRSRLTACQVCMFLEEYHNSWKYAHPPFEKLLKLITMNRRILERLWYKEVARDGMPKRMQMK